MAIYELRAMERTDVGLRIGALPDEGLIAQMLFSPTGFPNDLLPTCCVAVSINQASANGNQPVAAPPAAISAQSSSCTNAR